MNDQIPSMALVHEAHELFSQIKQNYKEDNLERLKALRERMIIGGFDAPFIALLNRTYVEGTSEREEEIVDLKKQMNYFRQAAILKKGALRRANVSIAAHLLARSFIKMGYGDILEHLPFDGNYIDFLFKSGVQGVRVYKELLDLVEARGETIPVYIVEVFFKDQRYRIKVRNKELINEKVTKEFGPEANIMNIKTGKKEYPIIKSKSVRVSLISAIVSYVSKDEENIKELRKKCIGLLFSPLFKFYMVSSAQERKTNNLYYSLTNDPSTEQIKLFNLLEEVEPEFKNAEKIIGEKLKMEKKIKIKSNLIGAGVLAKHLKKDNEWIAEYLKMDSEEVEKGIEYLKAYSEKGKGAEFLEHLE